MGALRLLHQGHQSDHPPTVRPRRADHYRVFHRLAFRQVDSHHFFLP